MCRHYPTLSPYQKEKVHPSLLSSPTPEARQIIQVRYTQRNPIRHFRKTKEKEQEKEQEKGKKTATVKQKKSARSAIRKTKPGVPSYHRRIYEKGKKEERREQEEKEENSHPSSISHYSKMGSASLLFLFTVLIG
jgi:hypothetical protein